MGEGWLHRDHLHYRNRPDGASDDSHLADHLSSREAFVWFRGACVAVATLDVASHYSLAQFVGPEQASNAKGPNNSPTLMG